MKFYGGADEGDRTMIDAHSRRWRRCRPSRIICGRLSQRPRRGRIVRFTPAKPTPGASYLNSDSLRGNMDPGAHAVAMVFKALTQR